MSGNIDYYNENAEVFFNGSVSADMSEWRDRFIKYLPAGGRILDAGCGSGRDSRAFIKQGFSVVATDASKEMCRLASELLGQEVWQMRFDEISFEDEMDGIWACASLLHVLPEEMEDVIYRLRKSLCPNGIVYASFKYGEDVTRKGDRTFTNYTETTVAKLFESSGFTVLETGISTDVRPGREDETWVNVILRKS